MMWEDLEFGEVATNTLVSLCKVLRKRIPGKHLPSLGRLCVQWNIWESGLSLPVVVLRGAI